MAGRRKKQGIYRIINKVSGKEYIGITNDITQRKCDHWKELRKNNHGNQHLQHSFNKHGEKSFTFEVLLFCDKKLAARLEKSLLSKGFGEYNMKRSGCYSGGAFPLRTLFPVGETHPNAKLTNADINTIRVLCNYTKLRQHQIANLFGVGQDHISRIKNKRVRVQT